MSEEDREKLLKLRGITIDVGPDYGKITVERRPMTEAEERLLEAAMQGAESRQYFEKESEFNKAQIAVLEERTSVEDRERFRLAYIQACEAAELSYQLQKQIPRMISHKIIEEVDKLRSK